MGLLNNPWVVGIGGSVISGVLVAWITKAFFTKRVDGEHRQKVASANREVIYAIRPGISEGFIPTRDIVLALTSSTARRYDIQPSDLHSPIEFAEELVKEVMDSSFLSSATKSEYCMSLILLRTPAPGTNITIVEQTGERLSSPTANAIRDRYITVMSLSMGLVTALMSIIGVFQRPFFHWDSLRSTIDSVARLGIPAFAALAASYVGFLFIFHSRDLVQHRKKLERTRERLMAERRAKELSDDPTKTT